MASSSSSPPPAQPQPGPELPAAPMQRERLRSLRNLRERLKTYKRRATAETLAVRALPQTPGEEEAEQAASNPEALVSPPLSPVPGRAAAAHGGRVLEKQGTALSDADLYTVDEEMRSDDSGSGELSLAEESRDHLHDLPPGKGAGGDHLLRLHETLQRRRMSDPQLVGEITVQELEELLAAVTEVTEYVGDGGAPSSTQALIDTMKHVRDSTQRMNQARLEWEHPVKSVLVVKKRGDSTVTRCFKEVVTYLFKTVPGIKIYFQPSLFKEDLEQLKKDKSFRAVLQKMHTWKRTEETPHLARAKNLDLVVSLGGDGTLLHIASMFQAEVPPVLCFALGSLGFLTLFDIQNYKAILDDVLRGGQVVTVRMRLQCQVLMPMPRAEEMEEEEEEEGEDAASRPLDERPRTPTTPMPPSRPDDVVHAADGVYHLAQPVPLPASMSEFSYVEDKLTNTYHLLNELVIDRGPCPYLTNLDVYVDGMLVTCVQGDGLIVATPTGSTAYSVAAGGSMVHPSVACILLTPICPHSLSFRPIIVPSSSEVRVTVPHDARNPAFLSFDGRNRQVLHRGCSIIVTSSPWPVPSVNFGNQSGDWFAGLSSTLGWNSRERQKSFEPLSAAGSVAPSRKMSMMESAAPSRKASESEAAATTS